MRSLWIMHDLKRPKTSVSHTIHTERRGRGEGRERWRERGEEREREGERERGRERGEKGERESHLYLPTICYTTIEISVHDYGPIWRKFPTSWPIWAYSRRHGPLQKSQFPCLPNYSERDGFNVYVCVSVRVCECVCVCVCVCARAREGQTDRLTDWLKLRQSEAEIE